LKFQFWNFNFNNPILKIYFWNYNFENTFLKIHYWNYNFGNTFLKIHYWNSNFENTILKFQFWNSNFEILILKLNFWNTTKSLAENHFLGEIFFGRKKFLSSKFIHKLRIKAITLCFEYKTFLAKVGGLSKGPESGARSNKVLFSKYPIISPD